MKLSNSYAANRTCSTASARLTTTALILGLLTSASIPDTAQALTRTEGLAVVSSPLRASAGGCASTDSTLLKLYESGQTFEEFLAATKARREGWHGKADSAAVAMGLIERARAVKGDWKLLVIAIDRCGDSMNSVPYLAKLAANVPGLDLRIVLPDQGKAVQAAHRSMDGRLATPTIVLLDSFGNDVGCIVELPAEIRRWAHAVRSTVISDSLHAGIRDFYLRDKGSGIATETVEMLEAAGSHRSVCERGEAAR